MIKLFDSCFLASYETTDDGVKDASIDAIFPEDITFNDQKKEKIFDFSRHFINLNDKTETFFAFNIDGTYYFTLAFIENARINEIVIETNFPFAYVFSEFFKEAEQMFKRDNFNDPSLRFAFITSLLQTWENHFSSSIEVNFPTGLTQITLNNDHFSFSQYNPTLFFNPQEIMKAYECFIYSEPIVVYAKDAHEATLASFGLFSILAPLQYSGPFALWMPKGDKRIETIKESGLLFVATNEESLLTNDYFKLSLKAKNTGKQTGQESYSSCFARTKYLGNLFGSELDAQLIDDPWADTLHQNLNKERTKSIAKNGFKIPYDEQAAIAFDNSETWKLWRKRLMWREEWLESMKSCDPTQIMEKHKTPEEIELIKTTISKIPDDIKNDKHLMAVVKKYKKIIESLLSN